jgi:hypothetical protein
MSDISNQLIKNSYDYVLQSDLVTGIVYRIGGAIPVNPIFLSGLTINSGFTYSNGTEQNGYVLTCDASGNANWGPASAVSTSALTYYVSATTPTGVTLNSGDRWFDTSTGDELVWINDGDSSQWIQICCGSGGGGGTDTYVTGLTINGNDIILTQNRTDAYSSFTISLSGITGSGLEYFVSASTPTGTIVSGDRWFNTTTGIELVYIDDGDSQQWVQPFSVPGPLSPDAGYYTTTGITTGQSLTWDKTYWGISGNSNVDLVLPSVVGKEGYYLIIKDEAGICGTYRIRLTPSSGTIDNNNYVDMNINYMSLTCMVRGGNWYLI